MFFLSLLARLEKDFVGADALFEEGLALGFEGTCGAGTDTLAAENAGGIHHAVGHKRADGRLITTPVKAERVGILGVIGANLHATPAVDALVVIAQEKRVVVVDGRFAALGVGETGRVCAILSYQRQDFRRFVQINRRGQHL